jgi:hypothetical protein
MARRFSLGRLFKAVRNIVAPPQREAPEERPPPRDPEPFEPRSRDPFRAAWNRQNGQGSYKRNLRVFHSIVDTVESDPSEQAELWQSYIKHINKGEGRFRRNSNQNMFWRDSGIDPRDFNWKAWRAAMGYEGKRRSRTP